MYPTKKNIRKWKRALDREMIRRVGIVDGFGFSKSQTNALWISDYEDVSAKDAVEDELSYWGR